jgi:hypothetical protein
MAPPPDGIDKDGCQAFMGGGKGSPSTPDVEVVRSGPLNRMCPSRLSAAQRARWLSEETGRPDDHPKAAARSAMPRVANIRGHLTGSAPALMVMFFIVFLIAAALVFIGLDEGRFGTLRAAVALPLLLMVGLGSLLLLITTMVVVLHAFGLTDEKRAFGLPDGSMQAVIALSLVLIFVIASLYLYSSLPTSVTKADREVAQDRREFAQQLLTTVGTLAVAVAGFYFGTRSVETARTAVGRGSQAAPIRVVSPRSPVELDDAPGTELSGIILETIPSDRRVVGFIAAGDDTGVLEQLSAREFRYRRGDAAQSRVRLVFELAETSDRAELEVILPST